MVSCGCRFTLYNILFKINDKSCTIDKHVIHFSCWKRMIGVQLSNFEQVYKTRWLCLAAQFVPPRLQPCYSNNLTSLVLSVFLDKS